jgi:hypothetical protein
VGEVSLSDDFCVADNTNLASFRQVAVDEILGGFMLTLDEEASNGSLKEWRSKEGYPVRQP